MSEPCEVCGEIGHGYRSHLDDAPIPGFVGGAIDEIQDFEQDGNLDQLIDAVKLHVDEETSGGERAWGLWIIDLLEKLLALDNAPGVVAEIDDYLKGQQ